MKHISTPLRTLSETNPSLQKTLEDNLLQHKLFDTRTCLISGGVDSKVAEDTITKLLVWDNENDKTIQLFINSPGGEVNSGLAIYDTIRFINSPVAVISAGLCASIATIINCAVDPEMRFSLPNTKFLIHQPLIMGRIQGQASDLEIHADDILKTRDRLNHILAHACKQAVKKVEKDTLRDYWMNAKEAKEYGLISNIIEYKSDLHFP
ncbi:MAG: ATP-dependent Clp protease proteolytic subunit [Proteobacteria bacterium]|nr:ATP-dependent Clp protease proteolytic subunit [Pseudomonadota bacterium]